MHSKVEVIGRLGKDPESRFTASGQQVTSFSVASDYKYTNASGEKISETTWFRVSVWGNLAKSCNEYLKKGSLVFIEGRLVPDKSTGGPRIWKKSDGESSASFDVNAFEVKFLSSKSEAQPKAEPVTAADPDEYPF